MEQEVQLEPRAEIMEVGPCKYRLKIEVSLEKLHQQLDMKYKTLAESVPIPGFRKGKAPRRLLERKFGKAVLEDLKYELMNKSFEEVKEQNQLKPVGTPEVNTDSIQIKLDQPFVYEVTIEAYPKFDLSGYKGIKVKRPKVQVDEKEVDALLEGMRELKAEYIPQEGISAQKGDQVVLDIELKIEGKLCERSENAALFLNESISFFNIPQPEFYKSLLGKKANEQAQFCFTLPGDLPEKGLSGKEVAVSSYLKAVKRKVLPELTDEWARSMGMESLVHLRENLFKQMLQEGQREADERVKDQIVGRLLEMADFAMPEGLVQSGAEEFIKRLRLELLQKGLSEEEIEKELERSSTSSRDLTIRGLKTFFILDHIAEKEKIYVTEEEVEECISQVAAKAGKWPHEFREYLETHELIPQLRRRMREAKVKEQLLQWAVIEE
jgi:trigger factor